MIKKIVKKSPKKTIKKVTKKVVAKTKTKIKKVLPIPKGYHSITPYLFVTQASKAINFYIKAFGAKETMRMELPGGKIAHAELKIGDSKFMLADEAPEMDAHSPSAFGGSPISIHLYVKNVDAVVAKAVSAGAKIARPVEDMFYGDRCGTLKDPYGHTWYLATHIEDVSNAKAKKRMAEMSKKS